MLKCIFRVNANITDICVAKDIYYDQKIYNPLLNHI